MAQLKYIISVIFPIMRSHIWVFISFGIIQVLLLQVWMIPIWFIAISTLVLLLIVIIESDQTQFGPKSKKEKISPQSIIESNINAILNSLPDSAFIVDQNGVVKFINGVAKSQFELVQLGDSLTLFFRTPLFVNTFNQVCLSGKIESFRWTQEVPTETVLEANISPLNGNISNELEYERVTELFLVIISDHSEQHRIEQMRAGFVANASHELRTPLASISGFIETLQGSAKRDPAAQDKFLTIMQEQTRRMSKLIDDLLSLSRIEVKPYINLDVTADLVACVRHIVATLSPIAKDKSVEIKFLCQLESALVNGEFDEIVQVIENLTNNAIEYASDGGIVEIRLTSDNSDPEQSNWHLSVQDFGPGIDSVHLPRLTERFYRVENGVNSEKKGTGLGLSIVKHVLNRHRGRLMIESELGKGSKFTVILPFLKNINNE